MVKVKNDTLEFGDGKYHFGLSFERTLRIPDDGKTYPLPPSLGRFPIKKVEDYPVPDEWKKQGGVFIPMYQREAMWIRFIPIQWKPHALKIGVGKINAVSGKPWREKLEAEKNDYLVSPPQPWLDGINSGNGTIRQFIAMPLGMGYTVEGQLTGKEEYGGLQIIVYPPKPGKFPDNPIDLPLERGERVILMAMAQPRAKMGLTKGAGLDMGLGAGGTMKQKLYTDEHGVETWDEDNAMRVYVHIVNSMMYREITGEEAPATPITAHTYANHGYPWYDVYDEHLPDIAAPDELKNVKSIKEMDAEKGFAPQQDDSSVEVPDENIIKYNMPKKEPNEVSDGEW